MATKRNIFEDVGNTPKQTAAPGGIDRANTGARRSPRLAACESAVTGDARATRRRGRLCAPPSWSKLGLGPTGS